MNFSYWWAYAYNLILDFAPKVFFAILTLTIGFWVVSRFTIMLDGTMRRRGMESSVRGFLTSLVNIGLKIMILLSVAGTFGIQTTSFIAIFSALAFAVGTALSGSLGHFASGVLLLVFRPYRVGDWVNLAGQSGYVKDIQVFNTVLLTLDNKSVIIPNGTVTGGIITNMSSEGYIRVEMIFHTADHADIDQVRSIVQRVAATSPLILKNPPIEVHVNGNPVGATDFAVRPYCKPEHYWDVYFYMQEHVKKAFLAAQIPPASPVVDVKVVR
jgi:small conductance mechanosensitive channel